MNNQLMFLKDPDAYVYKNTVEVYDHKANKWSSMPDMVIYKFTAFTVPFKKGLFRPIKAVS